MEESTPGGTTKRHVTEATITTYSESCSLDVATVSARE